MFNNFIKQTMHINLRTSIILIYFLNFDVFASFPEHFFKSLPDNSQKGITIPQTIGKIKVDGILNESFWERSAKTSNLLIMRSEQTAKQKSVFLFSFTESGLCVAVICEDNKIIGKKRKRDNRTWRDDCVEIFIDPKRKKENRFQFIFSAWGNIFDAKNGNKKWNASKDLLFKSKRYKTKGYVIETFIPFESLDYHKIPKQGNIWDLKLAREDYNKLGRKSKELSSWKYVGNSFSDIGSFGKLIFIDENICLNGDFSNGIEDGWAQSQWRVQPVQGSSASINLLENEGHDNAPCLKVDIKGKGMVQTWFNVTKHRKYKVSVWIKPLNLTNQQNLALFSDRHNKVKLLAHKKGWQKLETYFDSNDSRTKSFSLFIHNAKGTFLIDDFKAVEIDNVTREKEAICWTGNAKGSLRKHNQKLKGKYAYFELGTKSPWAPEKCDRLGWPDNNMSHTNWIPFDKGKLTDGKPSYSRYGVYSKHPGKTIVLDLGKSVYLTDVIFEPIERKVKFAKIYLKQKINDPYLLVQSKDSKLMGIVNFTSINAHARYVRIDHSGKCGMREVYIWGKNKKGNISPKPFAEKIKEGTVVGGISNITNKPISIFPTPKKISIRNEFLDIKDNFNISIPSNSSEDLLYITDDLKTWLAKITKKNISIVKDSRALIEIHLNQSPNGKREKGEEGYHLIIDQRKITIKAGGLNGAFYACQTLLQLFKHNNQNIKFHQVEIKDWPSFPMRIVQFWAKNIQQHWNGINNLSRLRWNYIIDASGQKTQISKFKKLNQLRLETIPTCAPAPNGSWYISQGCVEMYPGESLEDLKGMNRLNPNVSHPRIPKLLKKEFQQASLYPGKYAYLNGDEMYQEAHGSRWNVSPENKARNMSGDDLFYEFYMKIYNGLKKIGKKPIMMDLMLSHVNYKGISNGFSRLPKDIPLTDWQGYHKKTEGFGFKTIEYFITGYQWRAPRPNRPQLGAMYSADWYDWTPTILTTWAEWLWHDTGKDRTVESAEMLQAIDQGLTLLKRYSKGIIYPSELAEKKNFKIIPLTRSANENLSDHKPADGQGLFDLGAGTDLSFLKGKYTFGKIPFQIGNNKNGKDICVLNNHGAIEQKYSSTISIPIRKMADSIIFLHSITDRIAKNYTTKVTYVGNYFIEYEDGSMLHQAIQFGNNIRGLSEKIILNKSGPPIATNSRFVYQGKMPSGKPIYLNSYEWINPYPQKKISKVWMKSAAKMLPNKVVLFALTVCQSKAIYLKQQPLQQLIKPNPKTVIPRHLKEVQLAGGRHLSRLEYHAPEGIIIKAKKCWGVLPSNLVFRMERGVGYISTASNHCWQISGNKKESLTITFPKSKKVSAIEFVGMPELGSHHFGKRSLPMDVILSASKDGSSYKRITKVKDYMADRDLVSRHIFSPISCKSLKVTLIPKVPNGIIGLSHLKIYMPK